MRIPFAAAGRRGAVVRATALGLALAFVLAGCTNDAITKDVKDNYTSADGAVTTVSEGNRAPAISFSGTTDTGATISSKDYAGQVVVVNFWYAGCAPCRSEAPRLESVYKSLSSKGVVFIGVNTTDQPDTSKAFTATHKITYPSIMDADSGAVRLAFAGAMSPTDTPTTIVLDKKGRPAARVLGELDSPAILTQLVNDVLAESN